MRAALAALLAVVLVGCGSGDPTLAERGESLARTNGCVGCHSTDGSEGSGPTWKGLVGSERELEDGTTLVADDGYLRESIQHPSRKTVKGFPPDLMETVIKPNSFTEEELDALIAYLESLS